MPLPENAVENLGYLLAILAYALAFVTWRKSRPLWRAEFIRTYKFPPVLLGKLMRAHQLSRKDAALVESGLRQFFIAYLMGGKRPVDMPSRVADTLWHEFILCTRDYKTFCRRAFGGFLHHAPAIAMHGQHDGRNDGLRRVWWYACGQENIDPKFPTRLPLLFALDAELNVPDGFRYAPDGDNLAAGEKEKTYLADDFFRQYRMTAVSGCAGVGTRWDGLGGEGGAGHGTGHGDGNHGGGEGGSGCGSGS